MRKNKNNNLRNVLNDELFIVYLLKYTLVLSGVVMIALSVVSVIFAIQCIAIGNDGLATVLIILACALIVSALVLLVAILGKGGKIEKLEKKEVVA